MPVWEPHRLIRISPYATLIFKALQLVAPIAASVTGVVMSDTQFKHTQRDLELMKTLIASLPDAAKYQPGILTSNSEVNSPRLKDRHCALSASCSLNLTARENSETCAAYRQAVTGDFLWICPDHYSDYDPGLPSVPDPTP
jgi:internalin A